MALYKVELQVVYTQSFEVYASDADEALLWAEKECALDLPHNVSAKTDCMSIYTITDEGYIDVNR